MTADMKTYIAKRTAQDDVLSTLKPIYKWMTNPDMGVCLSKVDLDSFVTAYEKLQENFDG